MGRSDYEALAMLLGLVVWGLALGMVAAFMLWS